MAREGSAPGHPAGSRALSGVFGGRSVRKVECMECGNLVPRKTAHPVRDAAGNVVGFICGRCTG